MSRVRVPDGDRTPSLEELIQIAIDANLIEVNTSMPGRIVNYDSAKQTATVQPLFRRVLADNTQIDLPQIANVPVQFPRSGNAYIHFPLADGDPCFLIFSQRSLDTWQQSGDLVDPADDRRFDLTDCVAIPGVSSAANPIQVADPEGFVIEIGDGQQIIKPDGKFSLSNGTDEIVDLLVQLADALVNAQTLTAIGPQPFIGTTVTLLNQIKSKLEGFKV